MHAVNLIFSVLGLHFGILQKYSVIGMRISGKCHSVLACMLSLFHLVHNLRNYQYCLGYEIDIAAILI